MDQQVEKPRKTRKKKPSVRRSFSFSYKLKTVKLHLEGSIPQSVISDESGVSRSVLSRWCKQYEEQGEESLKPAIRRGRRGNFPEAAKEKMIALKRSEPTFGIRRISDALRRFFFLPGSPETVRRTLQGAGLMKERGDAPQERNVQKPRRFERSTPNQMWQSDITMFRLGGTQVYLIGFIDDYSRYMVGAGLYASQKAAQVLEVYRQAVVEYGCPKEMLTDNGRQYTNWRGKTRFEAEMHKDRVKHIRSRPHHPMTLGKIERFWESVLHEFLLKAQFASFEDARERLRYWIQFYNHRRPHQGIGGMCPADRFFEVTSALKKTIEEGVKENVLEMALKGNVSSPFYMVGRMNGQSVVLNVEKGKLKLRVDGEAKETGQEVVYPLNGKNNIHGKEASYGNAEEGSQGIELGVPQRGDAVSGGIIGMDAVAETGGSVPGVFDQVDDASSMAGTGNGGNASSPGAASEPGERPGLKSAPSLTHRETSAGLPADGDGKFPETGGTAVEVTVVETGKDQGTGHGGEVVERKEVYEKGNATGRGSEGASASPGDLGSPQREVDGDGGGGLIGDIEAMLLRLGAPGAVRNDGSASQPGGGPSGETGRGPGKEGDEGAPGGPGKGESGSSSVSGGPSDAVSLRGMAG